MAWFTRIKKERKKNLNESEMVKIRKIQFLAMGKAYKTISDSLHAVKTGLLIALGSQQRLNSFYGPEQHHSPDM